MLSLDWLDAFLIFGLFEVVIFAGLAVLLHLQLGLARIANLGVAGFWGVGMYTFGVLYAKLDWPFGEPWLFIVCAAMATLAAGLAGLLVGWFLSDLDLDGQLVGTLGFAAAVLIVVTTESDLTGGARGMGGLGFPYDLGTVKANDVAWLVFATVVVGVIVLYAWRVQRAPYGRLLIALGPNEPLARSLGKRTVATKLRLFALTSGAMGFLGALYAVMVRFLEIANVGVEITLAAVVGLVLGGSVHVLGGVLGVVLTVGFFDIVVQSYLPLPKEWFVQAIPVLREALFGLTLIVVLLVVVNVDDLVLGERPIQGLIGPNGAGKTTLMRMIMHTVPLDGGRISLLPPDGGEVVLSSLPADRIARYGVVKSNQVITDFDQLTILDSLFLAVAEAKYERPYALAAERSVVREHADEIRSYLDCFGFADPTALALSAGEKKLLDIVRCLLLKPRFLLLDEPAAGLPAEVTEKVMAVIKDLAAAGTTVVIVEHDLNVIWSLCEEVLFMAEGSVILRGDPAAIREHRTVVEKYLGEGHV